MAITIPETIEAQAREKAAAEGLTVEAYVAQLIVDDGWSEFTEDIPMDDAELAEVRSAIADSVEQMERGEARPAEEVIAELRAKHGFPR